MSARATEWAWAQELPAGEQLTLLALANEAKSDGVVAGLHQAEVATRTGAKPRTVRAHLRTLEDAGLVIREAQFDGGARCADLMVLALPGHPSLAEATGNICRTGKIGRVHHPSTTPLEGMKDEEPGKSRRGGEEEPLTFPDWVPPEMVLDGQELLGARVKVGGRRVTPQEMVIAAGAVAQFNVESGSEFGLGAHLRPIVMRIRERPSYDVEAHRRLVQSAWRQRWWVRGGGRKSKRPTPAVIYGNERVFEQVVQDAVDEANETKREEPRGRFDRKVTRG